MAAISFFDGLAVPISIPRYTCIESAEIISAPILQATWKAASDLPLAVGPVRIRKG